MIGEQAWSFWKWILQPVMTNQMFSFGAFNIDKAGNRQKIAMEFIIIVVVIFLTSDFSYGILI